MATGPAGTGFPSSGAFSPSTSSLNLAQKKNQNKSE
jgi:hypothetical protein